MTEITIPAPPPLQIFVNGHDVYVRRVWGGFELLVDGVQHGIYHTPGVAIEAAVRVIQQPPGAGL